jgi:predicted metal-dependent peptidase
MTMTIAKALFQATNKYPYYARGFSALTPVKIEKSPAFSTFGVDKYWRLYYSDEALEEYKRNIEAIMCHELEHLLREHSSRKNHRSDHKRWNIACDLEINDDIEDLPSDACFVEQFGLEEGNLAEFYYDKVPENQCQNCSYEGSGVGGTPAEWEEKASSGTPLVSELEQPVLLDNIASDIVNKNKEAGNVPAGVLVWAEARATGKLPKLTWKRYIGRRTGQIVKGKKDYTDKQMSRRQDRTNPLILPGMQAYQPSLSVVTDTSGSMSGYADWVAGVLKDVHRLYHDVRVIDCDAQVYQKLKLKNWKDVMKLKGGGGTDMTKGIEAAQDINSDLIIVLTDGYTPWPTVWPKNLVALIYDGEHTRIKDSLNG